MNKKIEKKIKELELQVGCYDTRIDSLSDKLIEELVCSIEEDYTDVYLRDEMGNLLIVEVSIVNNEKDLTLYTAKEYFGKYGNLDEAYDSESITEEEYANLQAILER